MVVDLPELEKFFSRNRESIPKGLRPALREAARTHIAEGGELQTPGCPRHLLDEFRQVVRNERVSYENRSKDMFVVQPGYNYLFGGRGSW